MFEFQLSEDLTRRILANLKSHGVMLQYQNDASVRLFRETWGHRIVGIIGMFSQRARHEIIQQDPSLPEHTFRLVQNGAFSEDFSEYIGGIIGIPPGTTGDGLLKDIATELIDRVRDNAVTGLSPRAPVTGFVIEASDVLVSIRPLEPRGTETQFVKSTVIE